jgi:hypothetical protein
MRTAGTEYGGSSSDLRPEICTDPPKNATCYSLAAGQSPSETQLSQLAGAAEAGIMTNWFERGIGPTSWGFGPGTTQANEMMRSPLVQQNIYDFITSGKSSMQGWQNFGIPELIKSGSNPSAQFVGSYGWAASRSNGALTFAIVNQTSFDSLFYHLTGWTWDRSKFSSYGNVGQTIVFQVPCGG